jgi:SAM-dependent methyltransferase
MQESGESEVFSVKTSLPIRGPAATGAAGAPPIRRTTKHADITVALRGRFMQAATASQRAWHAERSVRELAEDLDALDGLSARFVAGSTRPRIAETWERSSATETPQDLIIEGQQVMQRWEAPLMRAMAAAVTAARGHVLEVGFGMGISATMIQEMGTAAHTIVECHDEMFAAAERFRTRWTGRDIRLLKGRWQDALADASEEYDAIFFDTYPTSESEFLATVIESTTFAEHFFETAARLLRPGGVFTYYSNEIDSLGRTHQRLLLDRFSSVTLSITRGLSPPPDCHYWWSDSMAVVRACK